MQMTKLRLRSHSCGMAEPGFEPKTAWHQNLSSSPLCCAAFPGVLEFQWGEVLHVLGSYVHLKGRGSSSERKFQGRMQSRRTEAHRLVPKARVRNGAALFTRQGIKLWPQGWRRLETQAWDSGFLISWNSTIQKIESNRGSLTLFMFIVLFSFNIFVIY